MRAVLLVVCLLPLSPFAFAQTYDNALSLTLENDALSGSDNNYTNGLGVSWSSRELGQYREGGFIRTWAGLWSFLPLGQEDSLTFVSWTLAQETHTPDDISDPDPPLDDEPYAGMLYVDSVIFSRDDRSGRIWYLRLGVVGPSSQAEEVQTEFHEAIGADKPMGWNTQLPDEPIVNVGYHAGWLWLGGNLSETASWRTVPMAGIDVGTYHTGANILVYNEIGWNLPLALGVGSLRHGLATAATLGATPTRDWSFSFFFRFGGYAVAHYLSLDGTVFKDSRSVDSEPFLGVVDGGFAFRTGRFVIGLQRAEVLGGAFEGERHDTEFGTMTVGWYY